MTMLPTATSFIFCIISFMCASHAARLHHQNHQHHHQRPHHRQHHQHSQAGLEERESRTTQKETEPSRAPLLHLSGEIEAIKREILEQLGLKAPPKVPVLPRGGLLARLVQEETAWARYREMVSRQAGAQTEDVGEGLGDPAFNPTTFTLTAHTGPTMASPGTSPGAAAGSTLYLHFPLEEVLAACSRHRLRVMSAQLILTPALTQTLAPASMLTMMPTGAMGLRTASGDRARLSLGVQLQRGVRPQDQVSLDVSVALRGAIEKWVEGRGSNIGNSSDGNSSNNDISNSSDVNGSGSNVSNSSGSSTLAVGITLPSSPTSAEASPKSWVEGLILRVTLLPARVPKRGLSTRSRRDATSEDCADSGQKKCCRSTMRVSFADIGWDDWVKAPAEYSAHVCQGACPHTYKAANRYALLLAKMHRLTGGAVPGPCCVPAAFEPLVLLHYDSDGKLAVSAIEDMIVTRCHCQ